MAQNSPGLAVLVILANAGPQDFGADQSAQAAHHVHRGGTGEIVEAQLRKPAAAPNPVAGNGVDDQGDGRRVDTVSGELGALRHGAGDDGGRGGAEHRLENGIGPQGHPRRENVAVIAHNQRVNGAKQGGAAAEHNAEAHQPEAGRADAEVHQVLHQDVACVFRTGKARLTQGETRLHEEHQGSAHQHPNCVDRTECHTYQLFP